MEKFKAMEDKFVCSVCGKEYNNLDSYLECVSECVSEVKAMREAEEQQKRLEEVNAALNRIKAVKKNYEKLLDDFEKKYPEEYKMNFWEEDTDCKCDCKEDNYVKPIIKGKVNGKEVSPETLFSDPDVKYLAQLLGILD